VANDRWIEQLAAASDVDEDRPDRAPARLKARLYSALVNRLAETGPLLTLAATKACGGHLCVFEEAIALLRSERLGSMNPCNVCHARLLGERLEHAPIFWPHCPYSEFHKRSRE
jgi:hypothetical protein